MKRSLLLLLASVLMVSLIAACGDGGQAETTPTPTEAPTPTPTKAPDADTPENGATDDSDGYVRGISNDFGFESEWLDLRFTAPDGYIMATEDDMLNLMGIGAEAAGLSPEQINYATLTTVFEMMVTDPVNGINAFIMVEKLIFSNTTADQYVESLSNQLSMQGYTVSEPVTAQFVGQSYDRLDVSTVVQGVEVIQSYHVRMVDGRAVVFVTTHTEYTEDELAVLLDCFTTYN